MKLKIQVLRLDLSIQIVDTQIWKLKNKAHPYCVAIKDKLYKQLWHRSNDIESNMLYIYVKSMIDDLPC